MTTFLNISTFIREFVAENVNLVGIIVAVGAGCFLLRRYMSGGWCYSKASLKGKVVLITGANTGIGKATAQDLIARGASVIIAVRDISRGTKAAEEIFKKTGKSVEIKRLDLASLKNVKAFADDFKAHYDRLDILINNAGVMMCPQMRSSDGYELQFATNHLGHFLLTNELLDLLKKSAPSRIISVSSRGHVYGKINFDDVNLEKNYSARAAYGQSKLANILFTLELRKRLQGTGVTATSLHPGGVRTELGRHITDRVPLILKPLLYIIAAPLMHLLMKSPVEGAQTTIFCAVDTDGTSALYYSDCKPKEPRPLAKDEEDARRLWALSETMVKKALDK